MISEQGSNITFYVTWVNQFGEAASVSGTPTISVFHRQGVNTKVDVENAEMSLLSGTTYYYLWKPSVRAYEGTYTAKYSVQYEDYTNAVGEESFQIVDRGHYKKNVGGLVLKGEGVKSIWSEDDKKKLLSQLGVLAEKVSSLDVALSGLKKNSRVSEEVEKRVRVLNDLSAKMLSSIEKQRSSLSKIDSDVEMLKKREPRLPKFDDSKILREMGFLKEKLSEFKDFDKELRIPMIISELDDLMHSVNDLKEGFDNLQSDLCKSFSNEQLKRGLGLDEED